MVFLSIYYDEHIHADINTKNVRTELYRLEIQKAFLNLNLNPQQILTDACEP